MNAFRLRPTDPLDRKYLRTCAVYRLLRKGIIGKNRASDLLLERHGRRSNIIGTLELWHRGPLKNMLP